MLTCMMYDWAEWKVKSTSVRKAKQQSMKMKNYSWERLIMRFMLGLCVGLAGCVVEDEFCAAGAGPGPERREEYDKGRNRIIDISHRYHSDMPAWESKDSLGQFLWLTRSMANGSLANFSEFKLPAHCGTHVDAPGHVFDHYFHAGFDVDSLDLLLLNGPALLVDVPRDTNISADVMKSLNIPRGVPRVLFRTLNTYRRLMYQKKFDTSYVGFTEDGANWLVENTDIKLVGIDYLSVAAFDHLIPAHLVFLKGRVRKFLIYD
ncbi:Kynurenine formamidase [Spatholobus suberectus]|nr:Kynurenine formamidase [Spatholobus suberectus]